MNVAENISAALPITSCPLPRLPHSSHPFFAQTPAYVTALLVTTTNTGRADTTTTTARQHPSWHCNTSSRNTALLTGIQTTEHSELPQMCTSTSRYTQHSLAKARISVPPATGIVSTAAADTPGPGQEAWAPAGGQRPRHREERVQDRGGVESQHRRREHKYAFQGSHPSAAGEFGGSRPHFL